MNGYPSLDQQALDRDAQDAIEVIRRLWDSWEDDAVIRDKKTQRFLDASKLHYIKFESDNFKVLGPSITPRPPQGQPVVTTTITSHEDVASVRSADVVFVPVSGPLFKAIGETAPVVVGDIELSEVRNVERVIETILQSEALGAKGIRLVLSDPQSQSDFVLNELLPALRKQKLIRKVESSTLRARFGLPEAINRYKTAA